MATFEVYKAHQNFWNMKSLHQPKLWYIGWQGRKLSKGRNVTMTSRKKRLQNDLTKHKFLKTYAPVDAFGTQYMEAGVAQKKSKEQIIEEEEQKKLEEGEGEEDTPVVRKSSSRTVQRKGSGRLTQRKKRPRLEQAPQVRQSISFNSLRSRRANMLDIEMSPNQRGSYSNTRNRILNINKLGTFPASNQRGAQGGSKFYRKQNAAAESNPRSNLYALSQTISNLNRSKQNVDYTYPPYLSLLDQRLGDDHDVMARHVDATTADYFHGQQRKTQPYRWQNNSEFKLIKDNVFRQQHDYSVNNDASFNHHPNASMQSLLSCRDEHRELSCDDRNTHSNQIGFAEGDGSDYLTLKRRSSNDRQQASDTPSYATPPHESPPHEFESYHTILSMGSIKDATSNISSYSSRRSRRSEVDSVLPDKKQISTWHENDRKVKKAFLQRTYPRKFIEKFMIKEDDRLTKHTKVMRERVKHSICNSLRMSDKDNKNIIARKREYDGIRSKVYTGRRPSQTTTMQTSEGSSKVSGNSLRIRKGVTVDDSNQTFQTAKSCLYATHDEYKSPLNDRTLGLCSRAVNKHKGQMDSVRCGGGWVDAGQGEGECFASAWDGQDFEGSYECEAQSMSIKGYGIDESLKTFNSARRVLYDDDPPELKSFNSGVGFLDLKRISDCTKIMQGVPNACGIEPLPRCQDIQNAKIDGSGEFDIHTQDSALFTDSKSVSKTYQHDPQPIVPMLSGSQYTTKSSTKPSTTSKAKSVEPEKESKQSMKSIAKKKLWEYNYVGSDVLFRKAMSCMRTDNQGQDCERFFNDVKPKLAIDVNELLGTSSVDGEEFITSTVSSQSSTNPEVVYNTVDPTKEGTCASVTPIPQLVVEQYFDGATSKLKLSTGAHSQPATEHYFDEKYSQGKQNIESMQSSGQSIQQSMSGDKHRDEEQSLGKQRRLSNQPRVVKSVKFTNDTSDSQLNLDDMIDEHIAHIRKRSGIPDHADDGTVLKVNEKMRHRQSLGAARKMSSKHSESVQDPNREMTKKDILLYAQHLSSGISNKFASDTSVSSTESSKKKKIESSKKRWNKVKVTSKIIGWSPTVAKIDVPVTEFPLERSVVASSNETSSQERLNLPEKDEKKTSAPMFVMARVRFPSNF